LNFAANNEFSKDASPTAIADLVLGLFPKIEGEGAAFYCSAIRAGVISVARACAASDIAMTKYRLIHLMTGCGALDDLLRKVGVAKGSESREYSEFSFFLNQYRDGMGRPVNMQKIKFIFGGMVGRLVVQEQKAA